MQKQQDSLPLILRCNTDHGPLDLTLSGGGFGGEVKSGDSWPDTRSPPLARWLMVQERGFMLWNPSLLSTQTGLGQDEPTAQPLWTKRQTHLTALPTIVLSTWQVIIITPFHRSLPYAHFGSSNTSGLQNTILIVQALTGKNFEWHKLGTYWEQSDRKTIVTVLNQTTTNYRFWPGSSS